MAGVALLCCVKPSCSVCCGAAGQATCSFCFRLICWGCVPDHCASCAAVIGAQPLRTAADYEDSPRSTASRPATDVGGTEGGSSEDEDFYGRLDVLWQCVGYGELHGRFHGRLHRLPIMSRCSVFEPALGTWRFFGDLDTLRYLATSLQWELPSGIVVLHGGARTCLVFRSGADAEPVEPSVALKLLAERAQASICLVVAPVADGFEVAHLEMQQACSDRRAQARQRGVLDRLLRALISKYDVAFWRPE